MTCTYFPSKRLVLTTLVGVSLTSPASALTPERARLLSLARDFVERMEQKLGPADPQEAAKAAIPEGEFLLFQPRLTKDILVDAQIGAIKQQGELFLSFREFCLGMNLPITVNVETKTAKGWFIREDYTFEMDLTQNRVALRGKPVAIIEGDWFERDGDIFVSLPAFKRWMGIEGRDINWNELFIDVLADAPFPLEEKLARRKRKLESDNDSKYPTLPPVDQPYAVASVPNVDIGLATRLNKDHGQKPLITRDYNFSTAGDLFGQTTRTNTTFNSKIGLNSFTFNTGKKSETPDLLGPLGAREYSVGDITPTQLPLTGASDQEVGVRISNSLEGFRVGQTTRTFEGDLPPDWDVELYNDGQLISIQTVGPEGRFRFENVDLFAGDNDFKLVFYGPQGEVREEDVNIPVTLEDIGRDGSLYDVSLTLNNTQTYEREPEDDKDRFKPHLVVSYGYGLSEGVSVNTGLRVRKENELWKAYAQAGTALRYGKNLLNVTGVSDQNGQAQIETLYRRSFGKQNFRWVLQANTSGFDPGNDSNDPSVIDTDISLRGPLVNLFGTEFSYEISGGGREQSMGSNRFDAKANINARIGQTVISQTIDAERFNNTNNPQQNISTTTAVRGTLGKTRWRTSARYVIFPGHELESLGLDLNRNLTKELQARLEVKQALRPDKTEISTSLNWTTPEFILSPRVSYDTTRDFKATMNMRFGLAYDPYSKKIEMRRETMTGQGSVQAFVYLDKNGDRKFKKEDGDEPIKNAEVMTVQVARSAETDENGNAFIPNLPEYGATDVVINPESLSDPYYVLGHKGSSVYPRPGSTPRIEFPVHLSGELDGYVLRPGRLPGDTPKAFSGAQVNLINEQGERVLSSLTAFDGFFVISTIPPGRYLLMVEPNNLKGSGFRQPLPRAITMGYDGKVISDQNILLTLGEEVPINLAKAEKGEERSSDNIIANFGTYKSQLLAEIVKFRLTRTFRKNGWMITPEIEAVSERKKRDSYRLVKKFGAYDMDQARALCGAAVATGLSCGLTVPTGPLLEPVPPTAAGSLTKQTQG